MLTRLQKSYADQNVRFLLFPCNQFAGQEPGSNSQIKTFAENYVSLTPASNVFMFAKSNLNGVACSAIGSDICLPTASECCPSNDAIYQYLLSATSPSSIKWNFDKIVVDSTGKPYVGETIMHGGDIDSAVAAAIVSASASTTVSAVAYSRWSHINPLLVTIGFLLPALWVAAWVAQRKRASTDVAQHRSVSPDRYVLLEA